VKELRVLLANVSKVSLVHLYHRTSLVLYVIYLTNICILHIFNISYDAT